MTRARPSSVQLLTAGVLALCASAAIAQALTPAQQAQIDRERAAQQAQTDRERRALEQQYQDQLRQEQASQAAANQAKMAEAGAAGEWAGTTTALAVQDAMDVYKDESSLIRHNTAKQVEMIAGAAQQFRKSVKAAGRQLFGGVALADPFAKQPGSGVDLKALPACLAVDADSGMVAVAQGCAADVCNGRLQAGDVLLREDGSPVDSAEGAQTYLLSCAEPGAPLLVFRPSAGDVVAIP